jgi:hypothetical protein
VIAASVDDREQTAEVAAPLPFPVCYGVSRETGSLIGAWWEERRNHIQPSEFLLTAKGRVLASTYSSSPIGRMDPEEALSLVTLLATRKREG